MGSLRKSFRMIKDAKPAKIIFLSSIGLIACAVISLCFGAASFSISELREASDILVYIRIPRIAAAVFAGAGLAGAGVIIQMLLGNPLAGPNIIGVNAGAGFMIACGCLVFPMFPWIRPVMAFGGALVSVIVIFYLSGKKGTSRMMIILAGVMLNSLFNAATEGLYTLFPHILTNIADFRMGGLAMIQSGVLAAAIPLILLSALVAYKNIRLLELLSLGDDSAYSLGVNVERTRRIFLICAACMAGAAVSFAGLIGFLGLMVPHAVRFVTGENAGYLFLLSMLWGGILMVVCDAFARTAFAPFELPVGIVLSFIGAPVFLWILLHRR